MPARIFLMREWTMMGPPCSEMGLALQTRSRVAHYSRIGGA